MCPDFVSAPRPSAVSPPAVQGPASWHGRPAPECGRWPEMAFASVTGRCGSTMATQRVGPITQQNAMFFGSGGPGPSDGSLQVAALRHQSANAVYRRHPERGWMCSPSNSRHRGAAQATLTGCGEGRLSDVCAHILAQKPTPSRD